MAEAVQGAAIARASSALSKVRVIGQSFLRGEKKPVAAGPPPGWTGGSELLREPEADAARNPVHGVGLAAAGVGGALREASLLGVLVERILQEEVERPVVAFHAEGGIDLRV